MAWKMVPVDQSDEMEQMNDLSGGDWDAILKCVPPIPEDVLERMARAYDKAIGVSWTRVDAAPHVYVDFVKYRINAMHAALATAEGGS